MVTLFLKNCNAKLKNLHIPPKKAKTRKNLLIICFSILHFTNISQKLLPYQLESLFKVQYGNQLIPLITVTYIKLFKNIVNKHFKK